MRKKKQKQPNIIQELYNKIHLNNVLVLAFCASHLVFYSKCLELTCKEDYFRETERRIIEWSADHSGKDKQLLLPWYALNSNHETVDLKYFKIIESSYHSTRFKRKISETLYIKLCEPALNTQEQLVQSKRFNKMLCK